MFNKLLLIISMAFISQYGMAQSEAEALSNVTVGRGFPHEMDVLIPPNRNDETTLLVLLHGGGGQKAHYAHGLGIKKNKEKDYYDTDPLSENGYNLQYLIDNNLALVFIQGKSPDENLESARTWNNNVMDSGQDDVGLLKRVAWLAKEQYGFKKVVLGGHSMGGVMTNRMWCEASESYDAFVSTAGPISPTQWDSCNPKQIKPYLHITGTNDRILQIVEDTKADSPIDHSQDTFLYLDKIVFFGGHHAFVDPFPSQNPQFMNELVLYKQRAKMMCNQQPGKKKTGRFGDLGSIQQTNCRGKLKLVQVEDADHCIGEANQRAYKCDIPLNTPNSTAILDTIVNFVNRAL